MGGSTGNGAQTQVWACNGMRQQKWQWQTSAVRCAAMAPTRCWISPG
ncbi:hypothetical protein [Xanthomonas euvesicatoria]